MSEFLASYYRQLIDAECDRARLNRICVLSAFAGLILSAIGHWFDVEWLRCVGVIALIVALVCGANSLVQSIIIRRLRHELEGPARVSTPSAKPVTSVPNGKCSMFNAQ